jgi:hypothetical protein
MKIFLLPILGALLLVYSSQGQQPTATPSDPAALDSTEADNTKRNSAEENKNTDTAELPRVLSQKDQATLVGDFSVWDTPPQEPRPESETHLPPSAHDKG